MAGKIPFSKWLALGSAVVCWAQASSNPWFAVAFPLMGMLLHFMAGIWPEAIFFGLRLKERTFHTELTFTHFRFNKCGQ